MILPKEFRDLSDLEAMLLTSILGTLVALKNDLISFEQAESYWFNDETVDMLADASATDEIICLLTDCIDAINDQENYQDSLDKCIDTCKKLLEQDYTNYDEVDNELLN